jgi:hypothetical protein
MLALALVVVAGLGVTRLSRPSFRVPRSLDAIFAAGAPFVFLGLLLGPGLGVLDGTTLRVLSPILALGTGWIGAAFGARLDWRMLHRISPRVWKVGAALAATVFAATALAAWALIRTVPPLAAAWRPTLPAIVTLAAAATISAGWGGPKPARRTALFDTVFAAAVIAVALPLSQPHGALRNLALTILASAGLAGLFLWLARRLPDPAHPGIAFFGVVFLGAGLGYATGLSPFVICALMTAVIMRFSRTRGRVHAQLAEWGPSVYAAFLILAGALVRLPTVWLVPAALLLAVVRIAGRWASVRFGRAWQPLRGLPPQFGLATVPQGAAAVALAAGFDLVHGSGAVLTTVLIGVLAADALAGPLRHLAERGPTRLTAAPPQAEVT